VTKDRPLSLLTVFCMVLEEAMHINKKMHVGGIFCDLAKVLIA